MGHCANFALHNKSQEALLGMFILYFYPGLIFALNCDNSLTVFMLKASCLCHERSFASISIDNSQNRNSGILLETLRAPTLKYLQPSTTRTSPRLSPHLQQVPVPKAPSRAKEMAIRPKSCC